MTIDERNDDGVNQRGNDAWLESLIRQDAAAAPYVDDAGFTDAMIAKLPVRSAHAPYRWIVPAMALLGFIVGLVVLSGGETLSVNLTRLASFESLSMRNLLIVALPLGILYWLGVGAAWQER